MPVTRPLGRWAAGPLPIGITMGDPAGIGPEVVLRALERTSQKSERRAQSAEWRVIGSRKVFEREQKRLGTKVDLSLVDDSVTLAGSWKMGRVQRNCGRAAFQALDVGVDLLKRGEIRALVTAPVSKEALRLAGFRWPGQTEFLASRLSVKRCAMLAWTPAFKVVFVTIHMPLARVARYITAEAVAEKTRLLDGFLRRCGKSWDSPRLPADRRAQSGTVPDFPRIGVMALNPHGSEFSLGEEDRIAAGVRLARRAGVNAVGPIPADAAVAGAGIQHKDTKTQRGLSAQAGRLRFDGFVAMYHDQAMIPAKLLGRDCGVNVTLGLPCIRTSPLHGTAFDIAGRGVASSGSMAAAIRLARKLASVC